MKSRLNAAAKTDVSILCLPDDAARELVAGSAPDVRLIDTSTAHRTTEGWVYGFTELAGGRRAIESAARVAVPGCHATGYISLAAPLVARGALAADAALVAYSLTGYSGGGKSMIAAYQNAARGPQFDAPRLYALAMAHKHLPEMRRYTNMAHAPAFCPVVADYYSGMLVSVALAAGQLAPAYASAEAVQALYADYYRGEALVTVHPAEEMPPDGTLAANALAGRDSLEIFVFGSGEHILLAARFDNLGKGASGAAVQNIRLMLGLPEG